MPNVLLMEDSVEQARAIAEWLENFGHTVAITHNVEEALERLEQAKEFDVLVTDIFTPRGEQQHVERGITLIDKIRHSANERLRTLPIISMSGIRFPLTMSYDFNEPKGFGSDVHIAKPLDLNNLSKTIEDVCAGVS